MDITTLVKLTSRAWSLSILALMDSGVAGRQAPLLAATSASRTAFAQSLAHLVDLELLERNPGHGHPLRPEYRLTLEGARIATIASQIVGTARRDIEAQLLRRSWTVPVLAVTEEPRFFSDIRSDLSSISDRALAMSLRQLEERRWIRRAIDRTRPSRRPVYQAANAGVRISRAIALIG